MRFLLSILSFLIISCDSGGDGGGNPPIDECGDGICSENETSNSCPEDCEDTIACSDGREGFCENPQYVGNDNQYECFPCEFVHSTSSQQGFYFFIDVELENEPIGLDDWVGAFNGDVCVGARQWGDCGDDLSCDVPVLGYDGSDYTNGYMVHGDIPIFKIYDASKNDYIDAIPSEEIPWETGGQFTPMIDLLSASSSPFTLEIDETGGSTLFIFNLDDDGNPITNLEAGDELGLFDSNGITDTEGNIGEILVGFGVWTGEQLEVTTIAGSDLSAFDGPILPGYIEQNMMLLKVWDQSLQLECDATYTTSFGTGKFNNLFNNINSIIFGDCD